MSTFRCISLDIIFPIQSVQHSSNNDTKLTYVAISIDKINTYRSHVTIS